MRYEAAPAFDAALAVHAPDGPLAWFAVHDEACPGLMTRRRQRRRPPRCTGAACPRPAFDAAMAQIQRAIADGELYQVNFTAPLQGEWAGEPQEGAAQALFAALQRAQPGGYAAFIDTGDASRTAVGLARAVF